MVVITATKNGKDEDYYVPADVADDTQAALVAKGYVVKELGGDLGDYTRAKGFADIVKSYKGLNKLNGYAPMLEELALMMPALRQITKGL